MWSGSWEDVKKFILWSYIRVNLNFGGRSEKDRRKSKM